jgi:glycosyltransferase involved in cell wall biosynthesis
MLVVAMLSTPPPTDHLPGPGPLETASGAPIVEVVVPVHNEQATLEPSVRRLHRFLSLNLPFPWRIVIADNASTDATPAIARALASELPGARVMAIAGKGRGRALRAAWSTTDADVLCYMDVDLSTDLRGLLPLIAGLVSGHSEIAIGTRLAPGSRVTRGAKRELISRAYNRLLHLVLRARFSDAQCGFKAITAEVARSLLPQVRDDAWFFDTELLMVAQRRGLRIHEVAVDWVDDLDSRVQIVPTALADLRGVTRLALQARFLRFALVGIGSTIAYAVLYLLLRTALAPAWANGLALAISAVANTEVNRRLTFGRVNTHGLSGQHAAGLLAFALALALTDGALAALTAADAHASRTLELAVLVVASAAATVTRYVVLSTLVFTGDRRDRRGRPRRPPLETVTAPIHAPRTASPHRADPQAPTAPVR